MRPPIPSSDSGSEACHRDAQATGGLADACFCVTLDEDRLKNEMAEGLGHALAPTVVSGWSAAFARWPVFVSFAGWHRMARVVQAIEEVVALPGWRAEALARAPDIAAHDPRGAAGVFFGYDFHVNGDQVGLIEINTNAGGALVNTLLARAQRECCEALRPLQPDAADAEEFESAIVAMFRSEWQAARGDQPLQRVVIVDEKPQAQYLYPEFLLFQRLFERHGIHALVADPNEFTFEGGVLRCRGEPVELVYNRLTDFYLESSSCAALRDAYLADAVVLTPHPQAHALYADKRRLVTLSDDAALQGLGVPQHIRSLLLETVPSTIMVTAGNAEELWRRRRELFFKPVAGFGSRAAYRGEKLTRRVWEEIASGGYVAQLLVPPGTRSTSAAAESSPLKFDLRLYTYRGEVQWTAARLYQGQTTNFRTPGGGFAPVYAMPAGSAGARCGSEPRDGHASFVFLLGDAGEVQPLPHELYVALARGEAASPTLAGRRFRAADWYMRLEGSSPGPLVNEWYGWVAFDKDGRFDPTGPRPSEAQPSLDGNIDVSALPTQKERARMRALLLGTGET